MRGSHSSLETKGKSCRKKWNPGPGAEVELFTHTPTSALLDKNISMAPPPLLPSPFPPPPHGTFPFGVFRDLSVGSLWWPLFWRLWVCELILDSDGDHFLFSPIFDRTPGSRYKDCYSLAKISEILAGANILSMPIFVTFSAWGASARSRYSAGESARKSRAASGNSTLVEHVEGSTPSGRSRRTSAKSGRSQLLRTLLGHNSKEILLHLRQNFVDASILLTPTYCRQEYFVNTNILSSRAFCWRQHFVDASILLMSIFSVDMIILLAPIFCRRQYFVTANIFVCVLCFSWLLLMCLNLFWPLVSCWPLLRSQ